MRVFSSGLTLAALLALLPGTGRAAEGVVPQLDFPTYPSQLFWLAVYFFATYFFMRYVGVPRVAAIVEARRAQVAGDLESAENLRKQAAETLKAYEATLAEAHGRARKLLAETHEKNVAILTEQTKQAAAEFDQRVGESVKRIDAARADAMRGIGEAAQGLAAGIVAKVAGRAPAPDSVARAIAAATPGAA